MPITTQTAEFAAKLDGRRLSPRICVTIEADQKRRMQRQRDREHRTQSEIVRLALRFYYEGKDEFGRPNLTQTNLS